jgi:hypothetical protein
MNALAIRLDLETFGKVRAGDLATIRRMRRLIHDTHEATGSWVRLVGPGRPEWDAILAGGAQPEGSMDPRD